MSMTPGPWEAVPVNFSGIDMWDIRVKGLSKDDPHFIADMVFERADATAIAAVPEMVALLKWADAEINNSYSEKWVSTSTRHLGQQITALLRRIEEEESA